MAVYQTSRLTAAADVNLAKAGLHCVRVRVYVTTIPGSFSWLYDGAASAHFPCPSNATRGHKTYKVEHVIDGNTIPSAVFTFNGGTSMVVELLFSDTAESGAPSMASYRAIRFARTDAGAVTGDVTANFAGGDASPKGVVVHTSASFGRVLFPSVGSLREQVEAVISDSWCEIMPAPAIPASASLTLSVITDAASSIQAIVYY